MGDDDKTTKKPKDSASKQQWNKTRKKYVPKPIKNSTAGEVTTYYLTPEELEYYRNLKPPIPDRLVRTTAFKPHLRKRGQT